LGYLFSFHALLLVDSGVKVLPRWCRWLCWCVFVHLCKFSFLSLLSRGSP